ncbi:nuclease [Streptomyces litchfieldiae]|uniref:Nuclease n=1 Tax=Streptomyces litchfieldiae TaxID=3075543 RepID=A0ABU2MID9_9ACTN|nr:nuclease [Streptomyces sp. DSM 44938]MDT0341357.1 nuclease [Streptomyces sp. DSM 44938]
MIDPIEIFWSPAGDSMPTLGSRELADFHDGDTPKIKMPVRMLSVDTPEVTAKTPEKAEKIDQNFLQLAAWIRDGKAPISKDLAKFLLPKLETGKAGTLQFKQGTEAAAFAEQNIRKRLRLPNDKMRKIFIRTADAPFCNSHRLLAYIAPNYTPEELATIPRKDRPTFNLDLIAAGWAAPFIIYPSIPGELDMPIFLAAAEKAVADEKKIWGDPATLLAYEYRAMEDLHTVTKKIVEKKPLRPGEEFSWRERYCVDMRSRTLHGPEDYFRVPPIYRLFLWPQDVAEAVGLLNLTPSARLARGD